MPLADPSDPENIFNLSYTASRPTDSTYAGAVPRLWFGSDYVIVGWYTGEYLLLNIYSYGGRWSEPFQVELEGVNPQTTQSNPSLAEQMDEIQLEMGPDFFVLYFHNQGNVSDRLYLYRKADYQFGEWVGGFANGANYQEIDLGTSNVQVDESCLVAGNCVCGPARGRHQPSLSISL